MAVFRPGCWFDAFTRFTWKPFSRNTQFNRLPVATSMRQDDRTHNTWIVKKKRRTDSSTISSDTYSISLLAQSFWENYNNTNRNLERRRKDEWIEWKRKAVEAPHARHLPVHLGQTHTLTLTYTFSESLIFIYLCGSSGITNIPKFWERKYKKKTWRDKSYFVAGVKCWLMAGGVSRAQHAP